MRKRDKNNISSGCFVRKRVIICSEIQGICEICVYFFVFDLPFFPWQWGNNRDFLLWFLPVLLDSVCHKPFLPLLSPPISELFVSSLIFRIHYSFWLRFWMLSSAPPGRRWTWNSGRFLLPFGFKLLLL